MILYGLVCQNIIVKKQAAPSGTSVLVKQNVSSPIIKAASQEYPWASKMKSVCNLNRVTVPVYLEDGTSKVTVPSIFFFKVLRIKKSMW